MVLKHKIGRFLAATVPSAILLCGLLSQTAYAASGWGAFHETLTSK